MNYFAHGLRFLDDAHFLAGTAVPDWLSVVNRRARVRSKAAERFLDASNPRWAAVAAGIIQHQRDDAWFHGTRAFTQLSLEYSRTIRELFPNDDSYRPSFLGHVLVEVLLDAALIEEFPHQLDVYYQRMDAVDADVVGHAVSAMATQPVPELAAFIPRFSAERFLYDYAEDDKLLRRLNRVMARVGFPLLPESFLAFLPRARQRLLDMKAELFREPDNA
jgi:hypothetical protein